MPGWAACTTRPLSQDALHQGPDPKRGSHLLCCFWCSKQREKPEQLQGQGRLTTAYNSRLSRSQICKHWGG